jgi:DNA repair exonuclease SbcCD ATPase subunit
LHEDTETPYNHYCECEMDCETLRGESERMGRLIGVISHVLEIKASFPVMLEGENSREDYSRIELLVK